MTELERSLLDFYQIPTAFPDVWPADKDANDSDASDDDDSAVNKAGKSGKTAESEKDRQRKAKLNRRKSRYQALERAATHRASTLPGGPGAEKGVQRDEPDPLGTTDSVVLALKRNGITNIQDDPKLRNRFLLSSTTFSPALFLSQVHTNASTESLVAGLDVLSRSIDQKSASLKVLVESNFERFVRAKATIDNVYKEMKYHGGEPAPVLPPRHARHGSRSAAFRSSIGGPGSPGLGSPLAADTTTTAATTRKRNALVKESEYGVLGIKLPLLEAAAKAEDVWGPALNGRDKEAALRVVSSALQRCRAYVEISAAVADSIKRNDHETLVEEYHRARRLADEARALAAQAQPTKQTPKKDGGGGESDDSQLADEQLYQILLAARMWHDVEEQIQAYKRDVWRKLTSMHSVAATTRSASSAAPNTTASGSLLPVGGGPRDQHMELISLLLELGVEDNPIWVWLLSRYDYLKGLIQATCDRTKVEIEVLRRRLASADKPAPHAIAAHLRALGRQSNSIAAATVTVSGSASGSSGGSGGGSLANSKIGALDAPDVVGLWDKVYGFLLDLLGSQGLLGEVVEFGQTVAGFVNGQAQATLPTGYQGESQTHHRLSQQGAVDLQRGALELVDLIREHVFSFFTGPPPEDISLLFSPIPPSPRTPLSTTSLSASFPGGGSGNNGPLSPHSLRGDPRFMFDPKNPPPPSPRRGEAWEKFAFWPPWANSISGVHYLAKLLALVGTGASEMAGVTAGGSGGGSAEVDRLRTLVGAVRERCVAAMCAAWNKDAETIKYVEDWHRAADRRDVTRMPAAFAAFEGTIVAGLQKILYVSEAMSKPGAGDIVPPPPTKLLQMVRGQYVATLYKALSGMVENAERPVRKADDDWTTADAVAEGANGSAAAAAVATDPARAAALSSAVSLTGALSDSRASVLSLDNGAFNAGDRNVRMLLTLSNLQCLRAEVVPRLNTQFENAFSVKLTDETKTIRDVLGQIDTRLFMSYTRPSAEALRRIVRQGLLEPGSSAAAAATSAGGGKPREVRPYIYEALLLLVLVHAQVSTTAAPALTQQVLSHLLETTTRELLDALKQQPGTSGTSGTSGGGGRGQGTGGGLFDLNGLMQATLDVEFFAQALSQYTTERAGELQSQIYQALDARTDDVARARLQNELPEMRSVLKRLRETSRNEFACFRKPKRSGGGGGSSGGGGVGAKASSPSASLSGGGPAGVAM
ncbi:exocyst complex component [Niveomyces insectorum RCEF 264]|uniref:Exocyst complex component n=1 Tax=Niveomyces insectorum RCEF 264 TaxID=1081102 RepID=A0A167PIV9_9HYPO|nr:exocyst complex component [Niveomyces insectorum RCEF 264]